MANSGLHPAVDSDRLMMIVNSELSISRFSVMFIDFRQYIGAAVIAWAAYYMIICSGHTDFCRGLGVALVLLSV